VRFLTLAGAEKVDPDLLFLERGLDAYHTVRASALSAMAFACRAHLPAPDAASPEQKTRVAHAMFELIAAAESEVARSEFLGAAAGHLKLPVGALQHDFETFRRRTLRNAPTAADAPRASSDAQSAASTAETPEQDLLKVVLYFEALGKQLSQAFPHAWIDTTHPAGVLLHRFLGEIEHDNWPGRDHLELLMETPEERALVASILFAQPAFEDPAKIVGEGLVQLRARALEPRLRKIELDLANHRADSEGDPISLIKERSALQRQLREPVGLPEAAL
jgi:DNA primase